MAFQVKQGRRTLFTAGKHSFVTAVRREKEYRANRGTVKTTVVERERIALTDVCADGDVITFSAQGHSLTVTVRRLENGAALDLAGEPGWAYEFRVKPQKGEAVFGGGEQYRQLNLRGERVVNFVAEHIKASTIVEKALLPRALYRPKGHSKIGSYAPMPVFTTSAKRMFCFDTAADGFSEFGGVFCFSFDSCPKSMTVLHAKSFEDLARAYAKLVPNRQYLPDWCREGLILSAQGGTQRIEEVCDKMLAAGAKVSAVWSQDWSGEIRTVMGKQVWWNWEVDEKLYPGLREAIARLNAKGVKFLGYINPYLVKDGRLYNVCKEHGWLITRTDGSVYHIKSTTFDAGMIDLTNPEAARFTKDVLIRQNMLDLGMSGWMADFGEYLPADCVLHDGDPAKLHNAWPVMWAKLNREAIEEAGRDDAFFFTRSGYVGIQTYAPIMWNGDQHTDYTRDYGMPCVLPASFSLGFSGVGLVHCDIGGFFSFTKMKRDDTLFVRWMEMGTFSALMRTHESIRPWANSQPYDDKVLPYAVKLTNVHAALAPYLSDCVSRVNEGVPVLRPDFWAANDFKQHRDPDCYFLGDDLFVAPVFRRGATARKVALPAGAWVHFWTGERYEGGKTYRVDAPLGEIPVFYRAGSKYVDVFEKAAEA